MVFTMSDAQKGITAQDAGLVACTHCSRVWPANTTKCDRCGAKLTSRDARSLSRVWAWWMLGLICYIPANLYPMLETKLLFNVTAATIVGGAVDLFSHGAIAVALVILLASVAIPLAKFAAIAYLALSVQKGWKTNQHRRMQIYEVVEFVGRWSMIDVFVVAVLSSLVQLGTVVSISPGPASLTFALSVVCTMLAARSFDSRLIWDSIATHDTTRDQVSKP